MPVAPTDRPGLARSLAAGALPAYLFPAATALPSGLIIGDERLVAASYTTIAVPSAVAAVAVTLGYRLLREPRAGGRPTSVAGAVLGGALGSLVLVAAGCAVLVGNGWFDLSLLQDALPSAALGGGVTAGASARARNRRLRAREATSPPTAAAAPA